MADDVSRVLTDFGELLEQKINDWEARNDQS